jgi:hypothetical protein
MRFGVAENLYGPEESLRPGSVGAFQKSRRAANLARTITRLGTVSFGP